MHVKLEESPVLQTEKQTQFVPLTRLVFCLQNLYPLLEKSDTGRNFSICLRIFVFSRKVPNLLLSVIKLRIKIVNLIRVSEESFEVSREQVAVVALPGDF